MILFDWLLIGWLILTGLLMVGKVGKEREPITPFAAVSGLIEVGVFVVGILIFHGGK